MIPTTPASQQPNLSQPAIHAYESLTPDVVLDALATLPADLAILMIEHDMDLVFNFADRMMVLAEGAVLAEGSPAEIRRHPAVRAAYLGEEA